jgi:hypothetical protein
MFNQILFNKIMFNESFYSNKKYIKHNCDDNYILYYFIKDRKINQMRQDIYFNIYQNELTISNLIKSFTKEKRELKKINTQIRYYVRNNNKKLYELLEDFNIVEFNETPPNIFKKIIKDAKLIIFDGNEKWLLVETDIEYLFLKYSGS